MPFLTGVHFQNYRSFLDAKCRLSPVTVVIGANNAGKSNLLGGLDLALDLATRDEKYTDGLRLEAHRRQNAREDDSRITLRSGSLELTVEQTVRSGPQVRGDLGIQGHELYFLVNHLLGSSVRETDPASLHSTGMNLTRVLLSLREDQNDAYGRIMQEFRTHVPEIEDPEFEWREEDRVWFPLVKEAGIDERMPLSDLSFGTLRILGLLTIIHQPNRPELILIKDIEHAIHPRGLAPLIETMRRISKEHGVQFIFTSQHPYVLDCFRAKEHWGDVVIVEKKDGVSRLANMDDRLKRLHYEEEMDQVRLSELWYSGLMGGVADPPPAWDDEP